MQGLQVGHPVLVEDELAGVVDDAVAVRIANEDGVAGPDPRGLVQHAVAVDVVHHPAVERLEVEPVAVHVEHDRIAERVDVECGVFGVAVGEVIPDNDHRNAACQPDQN